MYHHITHIQLKYNIDQIKYKLIDIHIILNSSQGCVIVEAKTDIVASVQGGGRARVIAEAKDGKQD